MNWFHNVGKGRDLDQLRYLLPFFLKGISLPPSFLLRDSFRSHVCVLCIFIQQQHNLSYSFSLWKKERHRHESCQGFTLFSLFDLSEKKHSRKAMLALFRTTNAISERAEEIACDLYTISFFSFSFRWSNSCRSIPSQFPILTCTDESSWNLFCLSNQFSITIIISILIRCIVTRRTPRNRPDRFAFGLSRDAKFRNRG